LKRRDNDVKLSNIRDHLGWLIGRTVVDVTAGDPHDLPDHDPEDEWNVVLHFDNGGTFEVPIGDAGFAHFNPSAEDGE
jgi:hypothetical protein